MVQVACVVNKIEMRANFDIKLRVLMLISFAHKIDIKADLVGVWFNRYIGAIVQSLKHTMQYISIELFQHTIRM